MNTQTLNFSADVSRLLDIVANALYTNHDVFLRELISNAADACDRLRYESIQNPDLIKDNPNFRVHIFKNTDTRTLTILDNGIGMSRDELVENLGTIAKSGTAALMQQMKQSNGSDPLKLIGQFGVGFYASFMVASNVTVISRKAGSDETWTWVSDGRSGFDVRPATADEKIKLDGARGTAVILDIKDEGSEFLLDEKIKQTVTLYSDHIDVKIFLGRPEETDKGEGQPINAASAIWMRNKSDITQDQYNEFYRHITHGFDEPLMTSHWRAEGKIEFNALLFIPMLRPWDLYDPSRKHAVKLYVRRVFISDGLDSLMYPWLRFVRGVIDSADLPLNISRESLQYNPVVAKIKTAVTKRILSDLQKLATDDAPGFLAFWGQFGAALKEGLYDAVEHREAIFKICRFYSTHDNGEKFTTLDEYISRMKDGQTDIYYLTGEHLDSLKTSPQLEGFRAKGLEVLYLTDTIDDFWLPQASEYQGKKFKSITKGDIDLDKAAGDQKTDNQKDKADETPKGFEPLLKRMGDILEGQVHNVRLSKRLRESPVCLIAPDGSMDMHMERVLKLHQKYQGETKPVLEINPDHALIQKLRDMAGQKDMESFSDAVQLLLDQARIIQGEPVKDAAGFARRMSAFIEASLKS
jgi:molecular chaperone HtpG